MFGAKLFSIFGQHESFNCVRILFLGVVGCFLAHTLEYVNNRLKLVLGLELEFEFVFSVFEVNDESFCCY